MDEESGKDQWPSWKADRAQLLSIELKRTRGESLLPEDELFLAKFAEDQRKRVEDDFVGSSYIAEAKQGKVFVSFSDLVAAADGTKPLSEEKQALFDADPKLQGSFARLKQDINKGKS